MVEASSAASTTGSSTALLNNRLIGNGSVSNNHGTVIGNGSVVGNHDTGVGNGVGTHGSVIHGNGGLSNGSVTRDGGFDPTNTNIPPRNVGFSLPPGVGSSLPEDDGPQFYRRVGGGSVLRPGAAPGVPIGNGPIPPQSASMNAAGPMNHPGTGPAHLGAMNPGSMNAGGYAAMNGGSVRTTVNGGVGGGGLLNRHGDSMRMGGSPNRQPVNGVGHGYRNMGVTSEHSASAGSNNVSGGADGEPSVNSIHSRNSVTNYSLNEKRNGVGGNLLNNSAAAAAAVLNFVNNRTNHNRFNSSHNNNTSQDDPSTMHSQHNITRDSSNNSSMSSRNSHPSSSNNSHSNGAASRGLADPSNPYQINGSPTGVPGTNIHGILRHSNNRYYHQAGGNASAAHPSRGANNVNNSSNSNHNNPNNSNDASAPAEREKVVRIDPVSYDLRDHAATRLNTNNSIDNSNNIINKNNHHHNNHPRNNSENNPVNHHTQNKSHHKPTSGAAGQMQHQGGPSSGVEGDITAASLTPLSPAEELRRAATVGDLGKIQTLLGKPPGNAAGVALVNQLDEGGSSALLRSACEGRVAALRLLLRHGANVDQQDSQHGNTALHEASWKGYSESCVALVRARADLHLRNRGGFAPLHLACQNGHNQSCRVLLLAGGDPNIKNNYGDTPLHTAARYGHAGVTRILLSALCDVKMTNKNGDTCLHIAAAMGRRKLTRILLEAGAEQTGRNKQNETPQAIARRKEFTQILEILQNPPPIVTPEERLRREKEQSKKEAKDGGAKTTKKKEVVKSEKGDKKREKTNDSGTSSKDSSTRMKEKKKLKCEHKDRRKGQCKGGVHWSPYGCHNYPPAAVDLPQPDVEALPKDPLKAGEQYFLDLAGNIKKGPVAVGTTCYCAPFFKKVEHKLECDKVALMDHIDAHHDKLDKRIHSLERKTHTHIHHLKETVTQKNPCLQIAEEQEGCQKRIHQSVKDRESSMQLHTHNLQQWVEDRLAAHDPALPPTLKRTLTRRGSGRRRDPVTGLFPLTRSRSEEALTENTTEMNEPSYRGLRVLDHPTSMYNLHQPIEDEEEEPSNMYELSKQAPSAEIVIAEPLNQAASGDERLPRVTDCLQEPQGSLDLMQDSSDSEGEDEDPVTQQSSFYTRYTVDSGGGGASGNCGEIQQGVGKLTLNHPYYANTGAIPKSSASSLPSNTLDQTSQGSKEVIKVDVHAPIEPATAHKWNGYNRYDPRNNKHYLYDVQEVEPTYGDVAPATDAEGAIRDSGCSEGSSQAEITDLSQMEPHHRIVENYSSSDTNIQLSADSDGQMRFAGGHHSQENGGNSYSQKDYYHQNGEQTSFSGQQSCLQKSSSGELSSEPHHQIQQQQHRHIQQQQHILQQKQQYQQQHQQFGSDVEQHNYNSGGTEQETPTYLDMDRYRIQQAVRRLYDGYLQDGRLDPAVATNTSGEGSRSSGSSGCSAGGGSSGRARTLALESSLEHDSHNDSGYSTRLCTSSQGPSPALSAASGAPDGSGSESRSGHSTSSPNNTVIAFPHHPAHNKPPPPVDQQPPGGYGAGRGVYSGSNGASSNARTDDGGSGAVDAGYSRDGYIHSSNSNISGSNGASTRVPYASQQQQYYNNNDMHQSGGQGYYNNNTNNGTNNTGKIQHQQPESNSHFHNQAPPASQYHHNQYNNNQLPSSHQQYYQQQHHHINSSNNTSGSGDGVNKYSPSYYSSGEVPQPYERLRGVAGVGARPTYPHTAHLSSHGVGIPAPIAANYAATNSNTNHSSSRAQLLDVITVGESSLV